MFSAITCKNCPDRLKNGGYGGANIPEDVLDLDETPTIMTSNYDGKLGDLIQKTDTGRCAYAYSCFRNTQVNTLSNAVKLNHVAKIRNLFGQNDQKPCIYQKTGSTSLFTYCTLPAN